MKKDVFLSLGSNIGNLKENLDKAIDLIKEQKSIECFKISKFYKSTPVECIKQNDFLNCIVWVKTKLNVHSFHKKMLKIESLIGKEKSIPSGPRRIDIDIVLFGDQIISTSELQIPHAKMHDRKFVLIPLMEINKDFVHPMFNLTIAELLKNIHTDNLQKVEVYSSN